MHYGILGTGVVGRTLGQKLIDIGHQVTMGSRVAGNEKAVTWAEAAGGNASQGTFADAAAAGDVIINATPGTVSVDALTAAGAANLDGKVIIDVSNPLDFSNGMPPFLSVSNTDSTGEQLQRAFPKAHIVKTLNTMNAKIMVAPQKLPESHNVFVNGNDSAAKRVVRTMLTEFDWADADIIDLGDITASRGTEGCIQLWLSISGAFGNSNFNLRLVRG